MLQQEKKSTRSNTPIPLSFSQGGSQVVDVVVAPESLPSTQLSSLDNSVKSKTMGKEAAKALQYRIPTWGTV